MSYCYYVALIQATKASNHSVRDVATVSYIFDIRAWLAPHIQEIHCHTYPHIFLFKKNESGKGVMLYKHWSHENWEFPEGDSAILKVSILHITRFA